MTPQRIGPYELLGVLGTGGGGCVYRALDPELNLEVAVKLLSSSLAQEPAAARRMFREIETLGELSHPNIVRVHDAGVHRGFPYLVMELIEGLTLRSFLEVDRTGGPAMYCRPRRNSKPAESTSSIASLADENLPVFDLNRFAEEGDSSEFSLSGAGAWSAPPGDELSSQEPLAVELRMDRLLALARPERIALLKDSVIQICSALAYIHGRGMIHRDLKPSNIMVDEDRRVRLMDFGLAKFLADDHAITSAGKIVGTYRYMAPEQLLGEPVDGRTDLYALGAILYELQTGAPLFQARTLIEMCRHVLETEPMPLIELNPAIDDELARITHRLLQKDPFDRYQTAEEVADLLSE